jgi:uncharacterized protein YjiS (DUF1127 family)
MATYTNTTAPMGAITTHRLVSAAASVIEAFRSWNENRRTVDALRRLSPSQLDDIGLTVADVEAFGGRL